MKFMLKWCILNFLVSTLLTVMFTIFGSIAAGGVGSFVWYCFYVWFPFVPLLCLTSVAVSYRLSHRSFEVYASLILFCAFIPPTLAFTFGNVWRHALKYGWERTNVNGIAQWGFIYGMLVGFLMIPVLHVNAKAAGRPSTHPPSG